MTRSFAQDEICSSPQPSHRRRATHPQMSFIPNSFPRVSAFFTSLINLLGWQMLLPAGSSCNQWVFKFCRWAPFVWACVHRFACFPEPLEAIRGSFFHRHLSMRDDASMPNVHRPKLNQPSIVTKLMRETHNASMTNEWRHLVFSQSSYSTTSQQPAS